MKVRELMTREPTTVEPNATLGEVATLMKQDDCGSIPVVQSARLVGIVTDRDIVIRGIAAGSDPKTQRVSAIMSADPVTVGPDNDVTEAEKVMADRQIRRLPVVENGKLVGIIVTAQIARAGDKKMVGETLKEISEPTSGRASHARG
ncbi:MAG TPA: CBS domain-containing protein [Candidatus Limnocylindria bacterium]|nr:CBS domain-containing protein [Candidatus Limnocylindria bacterium]